MFRKAFLIFVLLAQCAFGQEKLSITPVVLEGDLVPGVGLIESIENVAINSQGEWLVEANTDFANADEDGVVLKNDATNLFLREGVQGIINDPTMAFIDFFDSITLNDQGIGGFNFFIDPFAGSEDSGVYRDTDLVIQESDVATAPGLSVGTPYIGFFDVKINNSNDLMLIASIDDEEVLSTVDRAIILIDDGGQETLFALEGQILAEQVNAVEDFGTGPHESSFNNQGNVLFVAELTGDTSVDHAIYLDSNLIAQEGMESPVAGRNFELLASRGLDLNDHGDFVFKANLSGDTSSDDVIVVGDQIFRQEGDAAPNGFSLTGFGTTAGPVYLGNNGNVLWYGEWDDPNQDTNSGLFLNESLLVEEGVSVINDLVVDTINSGTDAFCLSDDGAWIIFEATLAGGINGAFVIELPGLPGDVNCDGSVDLLDVQPFIDLLSSGEYSVKADINLDGVVDLLDVAPFVEILAGI